MKRKIKKSIKGYSYRRKGKLVRVPKHKRTYTTGSKLRKNRGVLSALDFPDERVGMGINQRGLALHQMQVASDFERKRLKEEANKTISEFKAKEQAAINLARAYQGLKDTEIEQGRKELQAARYKAEFDALKEAQKIPEALAFKSGRERRAEEQMLANLRKAEEGAIKHQRNVENFERAVDAAKRTGVFLKRGTSGIASKVRSISGTGLEQIKLKADKLRKRKDYVPISAIIPSSKPIKRTYSLEELKRATENKQKRNIRLGKIGLGNIGRTTRGEQREGIKSSLESAGFGGQRTISTENFVPITSVKFPKEKQEYPIPRTIVLPNKFIPIEELVTTKKR